MYCNHINATCIIVNFVFFSSFIENYGKDIIYNDHNQLNFTGSNVFRRNTGSSIRVCMPVSRLPWGGGGGGGARDI